MWYLKYRKTVNIKVDYRYTESNEDLSPWKRQDPCLPCAARSAHCGEWRSWGVLELCPPPALQATCEGWEKQQKITALRGNGALAALHLHGGISRNSKRWNQPTRTIDEWMDTQNAVYTHNEICYSAFKRKDILTHSTTWMNHEGIMLIRGSQRSEIRRDRTVVARGQGRWELGAGV